MVEQVTNDVTKRAQGSPELVEQRVRGLVRYGNFVRNLGYIAAGLGGLATGLVGGWAAQRAVQALGMPSGNGWEIIIGAVCLVAGTISYSYSYSTICDRMREEIRKQGVAPDVAGLKRFWG